MECDLVCFEASCGIAIDDLLFLLEQFLLWSVGKWGETQGYKESMCWFKGCPDFIGSVLEHFELCRDGDYGKRVEGGTCDVDIF